MQSCCEMYYMCLIINITPYNGGTFVLQRTYLPLELTGMTQGLVCVPLQFSPPGFIQLTFVRISSLFLLVISFQSKPTKRNQMLQFMVHCVK